MAESEDCGNFVVIEVVNFIGETKSASKQDASF